MMSYLYPEDEVTFDKSGFGPLPDMLESYAEEEANSYFELYFEYPLFSSHERGDYNQIYVNMSDYLVEGNQVTYKPSHSREPHAFRIYKTEKQVERGIILVWARTRTADLRGNPVRKVKSNGVSVSSALKALKMAGEETHPFSFTTNIQSNISFEKTQTNVLDALAGEEYSILAITGGQMIRTNNNIYIGINESSKNIVEFRLGKNIEGISYEVDYSNVVTAVIPFYTQTYKLVDDIRDEIVRDSSGRIVKNADGTTKYNRTVGKKRESLDDEVIVYGDTVFSPYANDYSTPFYSFVEIRDDREDTGVDKDPLPPFTKTDINNRAIEWFNWEENLGVDEPEVSVKVDVHDISQSSEYSHNVNLAKLETLNVFDKALVYVPEVGIDMDMEINYIRYDGVAEKNLEVRLGTTLTSLTETVLSPQQRAFNERVQQLDREIEKSLMSSDGKSRVYWMATKPTGSFEIGDLWFDISLDGGIYVWDGYDWVAKLPPEFGKLIEDSVNGAIEAADLAMQEAKTASDKALADAKAYAVEQDKLITQQVTTSVNTAISTAEAAKTAAKTNADKALADAKAHAIAQDKLITQQVTTSVNTAISTAEAAKADAKTKSDQALIDAKAYAVAQDKLITQQVNTSVGTALSTAQAAKTTAESSYTNAVAEAERLVGVQTTAFNKKFEENTTAMGTLSQAAKDADAKAQSALTKAGTNANLLSTHQTTLNAINTTTIPAVNKAAADAMAEAKKADTKIADYVKVKGLVSGSTVDTKIDTATGVISGQITTLQTGKLDSSTYTTFYTNEYKKTAQGVTDTYAKVNKIMDANGNTLDTFAKAVYDKNATRQSAAFTAVTKNLVTTTTYTAGINGINQSISEVEGKIPTSIGVQNLVSNSEEQTWDWAGQLFTASETSKVFKPNTKYAYRWEIEIISKITVANVYHLDSRIGGYVFGNSDPSVNSDDIRQWYMSGKVGDTTIIQGSFTTGSTINTPFYVYGVRNNTTNVNSPFKIKKILIAESDVLIPDWSPAPEDMATVIKTNEIERTANYSKTAITSLSKNGVVESTSVNTAKDGITERVAKVDANGNISYSNRDVKLNSIITSVADAKYLSQQIQTSNVIQSTIKSTTNIVDLSGAKTFTNLTGYNNAVQNITGYLIIRTPINSNNMVNVHIGGYNYATNKSDIDIDVSFYRYLPTSILNHSYSNKGNFNFAKVQVGIDSAGKAVIVLGLATTSFSYPKITVDKAIIGHGDVPDSYINGWSMSISTSLTGISSLTNLDGMEIQSQVTQLSDSWSMKLTKADDVVTQINATSAGVLIQGKNIQLDGNVSMTSTFSVPNANIKDLAVNKITGTNAQFTTMITKGLTADVITSTMIKADVALFDMLFTSTLATARLTAQSAWITNAAIASLDAAKITTGTIAAARINASAVVTAGLTANVVKSTHIESSTGLIDKIFATDALITHLTSNTIFASKIKAINIDAARITSGTIVTGRINSSAVVTAGLTANVVKSTHIESSTALVEKIFATDAYVTTLTSKTIFATNVKAITIDASKITSGTIAAGRINAALVVSTGLVANVVKSTHLEAGTALVDKIFSDTAYITRLTSKTAFISSIQAISINASKITSGTLDASKVTVTNIDASNITANQANLIKAGLKSSSGGTLELSGDQLLSTASDGSQVYLQNGVVGVRRPPKEGGGSIGQIGYVFDGGSPTYTIQTSWGSHFALKQRFYDTYTKTTNDKRAMFVSTGDGGVTTMQFYAKDFVLQGDRNLRFGYDHYINGIGNDLTLTGKESITLRAKEKTVFVVSSNGKNNYASMYSNLHMQGNTVTNTSDIRLKRDIVNNEIDSLSALMKWQHAGFNYINPDMNQERQFSVIAQSAPDLAFAGEDGYLQVSLNKQVNMTSHALQQHVFETRDAIAQLKEQIATLQKELALAKGV